MATENPTVVFLDLLKTLKRRYRLLLLLTLLTTGGVIFSQKPPPTPVARPIYESSSQLLVTPPRPSNNERRTESLETWFASEQLLQQFLFSEDVLSLVAQATESERTWQDLKNAFSFELQTKNHNWKSSENFLLEIKVTSDESEKARALNEAFASELVKYTQAYAARETTASRQLLEKMAVDTKKQINASQLKLATWRKDNDIWDMDQLLQAQGQRISELKVQLGEKRQNVAKIRREIAQLDAFERGTLAALPWQVVELETSLTELASERDAQLAKLDQLRSLYTEQNASVVRQRELYLNSERAYQAERRSLVASLKQKHRAKEADALAEVQDIQAELSALKNDQNLATTQFELEQLKGEIEGHRRDYQSLVQKVNDARVEEDRQRNVTVFTVAEEPLPGRLTNPPQVARRQIPTKSLISALLLGLCSSALAVVAIDYFIQGTKLAPQVEEALDLPVLGLIPRLDSRLSADWAARGCTPPKKPVEKLPGTGVLVDMEPESLVAERFRSLIIALLRLEDSPKRILVTSCWAGEGKSMVCANLATALTRLNAKVALVDGDLRRPNLTHVFEQEEQPGLRQHVTQRIPAQELTIPVGLKNVSFLPAGVGDEIASELLAQDISLQDLRGSEESFLIVDSPPLSACGDSILLSQHVDGVLLVINPSHWDLNGALDYVQSLENHGVPILGAVLNGVRPSEFGRGYSDSYYNYYGSRSGKKSGSKC